MSDYMDGMLGGSSKRYGLYIGEVVDNDDPIALKRVKVLIPGVCEPTSPWALPLGCMLGTDEGQSIVPRIGAMVGVFFNGGSVQNPCYMPGPYGKRNGVSDVPSSSPTKDHMTFQWNGFSLDFDGTASAENLTIQDIVTGTKFVFARQTGDLTKQVANNENGVVENNRTHYTGQHDTSLVEGNLEETVGGNIRRESINGKIENIAKTEHSIQVLGGDASEIVSGSSSEVVGSNKSISCQDYSLNSVNVSVVAGGNYSLVASQIVESCLGIKISEVRGASFENVLGAYTQTVLGVYSLTVVGLANFSFPAGYMLVSSLVEIGVVNDLKKIITETIIEWCNNHTHPDPVSGFTGASLEKIIPGGTPPNYDLDEVLTKNVKLS